MNAGTPPTASRRWLRYLQLMGFYWLMGLLCTVITYGSTFGLLRLMFKPMVGPNLEALIALFWVAPFCSALGWVSSRSLTKIVRGLPLPERGIDVFASALAGVYILPFYVLSGIIENYLVGSDVSHVFGPVLFSCINATLIGIIMVMGDKDKARPVDKPPQ